MCTSYHGRLHVQKYTQDCFAARGSFIQRLCVWASDNDKMNLNLDPTRVKVVWDGLGGTHVNRSAKKEYMATHGKCFNEQPVYSGFINRE